MDRREIRWLRRETPQARAAFLVKAESKPNPCGGCPHRQKYEGVPPDVAHLFLMTLMSPPPKEVKS